MASGRGTRLERDDNNRFAQRDRARTPVGIMRYRGIDGGHETVPLRLYTRKYYNILDGVRVNMYTCFQRNAYACRSSRDEETSALNANVIKS